jgi:hypothetical protein
MPQPPQHCLVINTLLYSGGIYPIWGSRSASGQFIELIK